MARKINTKHFNLKHLQIINYEFFSRGRCLRDKIINFNSLRFNLKIHGGKTIRSSLSYKNRKVSWSCSGGSLVEAVAEQHFKLGLRSQKSLRGVVALCRRLLCIGRWGDAIHWRNNTYIFEWNPEAENKRKHERFEAPFCDFSCPVLRDVTPFCLGHQQNCGGGCLFKAHGW